MGKWFYKTLFNIKTFLHRIKLFFIRNKSLIRHIVERTVDVVGVAIFLSVLGTMLYFTGWFINYRIVFFVALAVTVIYLGWNIFCLYAFRMYIVGVKNYLLFNLPIYGALSIGAIVTGCFRTEPYYTFIFMPYKLPYYATKVWSFPGAGHIDRPVSAIMMTFVIIAPVLLMPLIFNSRRKKVIAKNYES